MSEAMNGYISKADALRTVCYDCCCYNQDEECCGTGGACADYDAICKIPPADVKPVVRAEWKEVDRDVMGQKTLQCGKCGKRTKSFVEPNFCHHCGADMQQRGELKIE